MNRFIILALALLFAIPLMAGCGQNKEPQDSKKPIIIKPDSTVVNVVDEEVQEKPVAEAPMDDAASAPKIQSEEKMEEPVAAEPSTEAAYPAAPETPQPEAPKYSEEIVIANFNSGEKPNNLGGNFGAWNKDPSDPTQWCKESFDNVSRHGDTGFAMKLDYSVDSPNTAYNGFWMMLPNFDATKYDAVNFWVKGDSKTGYTTVFKIELKNSSKQVGRYYVSNVSDKWTEISIPFADFKGLIDRSSLTEFVIVFEDRMASNKKGVLYIDDIRFVKK